MPTGMPIKAPCETCITLEEAQPKGEICDRLWEKGAYGAENKNVVFNLF